MPRSNIDQTCLCQPPHRFAALLQPLGTPTPAHPKCNIELEGTSQLRDSAAVTHRQAESLRKRLCAQIAPPGRQIEQRHGVAVVLQQSRDKPRGNQNQRSCSYQCTQREISCRERHASEQRQCCFYSRQRIRLRPTSYPWRLSPLFGCLQAWRRRAQAGGLPWVPV